MALKAARVAFGAWIFSQGKNYWLPGNCGCISWMDEQTNTFSHRQQVWCEICSRVCQMKIKNSHKKWNIYWSFTTFEEKVRKWDISKNWRVCTSTNDLKSDLDLIFVLYSCFKIAKTFSGGARVQWWHQICKLVAKNSAAGSPVITWTAVRAATIAGDPKPWVMSEKCVRWRWIPGSKICCGLVLQSGDLSWFNRSINSFVITLKNKGGVLRMIISGTILQTPGTLSIPPTIDSRWFLVLIKLSSKFGFITWKPQINWSQCLSKLLFHN